MFNWIASIILGILLSWLNLSVVKRSIMGKKTFLISLTRWIFLCFIILFLLKMGFNPIFIAIGFALFPFLFSIWTIKNGR